MFPAWFPGWFPTNTGFFEFRSLGLMGPPGYDPWYIYLHFVDFLIVNIGKYTIQGSNCYGFNSLLTSIFTGIFFINIWMIWVLYGLLQ